VLVEFLDRNEAHLPRDERTAIDVKEMDYHDYLALPLDKMANCRIAKTLSDAERG
jgi:hypothetical protein